MSRTPHRCCRQAALGNTLPLALAAWIRASPGWYQNFGKELPDGGDWTFLARALQTATVYE
ncbi:hypothetical protein [Streptomyces sp. cg36]|uniref:DUF7660 family protein n=1 Tax=Streptomyces sp. cg36 TaxID=3238798 RepID=UPI0034E2EC02